MKTYKILALDGGGIRGLLTAVLLERLLQAFPSFIENVDLIAGTSTGGILGLGLANGLTPTQLRSLYQDKGHLIFDGSWTRNLQDVGGLAGAKYDNTNLKGILKDVFGGVTLAELKKRVLIPTFNLDYTPKDDPTMRGWTPKFFHNYPGPDSDGAELAADVALRTSAAPTYFPTAGTFIDGGVVANNPSVSALCQALDDRNGAEKQTMDNIRVLSLGTGKNLTFVEGNDLDWGYVRWATPLVNILTDGVSDVSDYECRQLLGSHYQRVEAYFPPSVTFPLDDVTKLDSLVLYAEKMVDLTEALAFLNNAWTWA